MEYLLHESTDDLASYLGEGFQVERIDLGGARTSCAVTSVQVALDYSQRLWGTHPEYALLATPLDKPSGPGAGAILLIPYNDGGLISVTHERGRVPSDRAKPADWFAVAAERFQALCRPWF